MPSNEPPKGQGDGEIRLGPRQYTSCQFCPRPEGWPKMKSWNRAIPRQQYSRHVREVHGR